MKYKIKMWDEGKPIFSIKEKDLTKIKKQFQTIMKEKYG